MAITKDHYEFYIQAVDAGGDKTTRRWTLRGSDTAGDISDLLTECTDLMTDFAAVSNAVIVKSGLTAVFVNSGYSLPSVGQVEEHALISCPIYQDPLKTAIIDIPAPKDGIFVGAPGDGDSYNQVDVTDTDLLNYLVNFNGAASQFLVSDGESIVDNVNVKGRRTHSHSSNG